MPLTGPFWRLKTNAALGSKDLKERCQWYFLNYTPSTWENDWYNNIETFQYNVCERLSTNEELFKTISLVQLTIELQKHGRNKATTRKQQISDILSQMFYRCEYIDTQTGTVSTVAEISHSIEPLVGLLRDPFAICSSLNISSVPPSIHDTATLQSKRFLLLSISAPFYISQLQSGFENSTNLYSKTNDNKKNLLPWTYQQSRFTKAHRDVDVSYSKVILFDIGSSYFGGWENDTTAAAGLWFYEYYKRFNVSFDRIIAYESYLLDQKTVWQQLPTDVFPIYTFINTGVAKRGKLSPWIMLQTIARTNDHVIVKLDIDTPELENTLINEIWNNSSIYSLIDELFFEHHVTVKDMMPYWGQPGGTLKDSYELFKKLRQLGIRAHSWP